MPSTSIRIDEQALAVLRELIGFDKYWNENIR